MLAYYDDAIKRVEIVSNYFAYTEEYVLGHHVYWIDRKFKQAERQKHTDRQQSQMDGIKAQLAILDMRYNNSKNIEQYILPDFDELGKATAKHSESKYMHDPNEFVTDPRALMPHLKDVDGDEV